VVSGVVAPDIKGFAGPINLAVSIDKKGVIRGVRVLQSRETPAYVVNMPRFLKQFEGKPIDIDFVLGRTPGIDAMTGATITSQAATRIINAVDRAVAEGILKRVHKGRDKGSGLHWGAQTWFVLILFGLGLLVHFLAGKWTRLAFLAMVVVVGGLLLNVSLSGAWVQDLARFRLPPLSNTPMFLLTLFVLSSTVLLGPVWCAHLCPFGALQELVSRVGGRLGLVRSPSPRLEKALKGTRYVLLLAVVLGLYGSNPGRLAEIDPLSTVFSGNLFGPALTLAMVVSLGALFNFRFFCRNLCPVGALLSALGSLSSLFHLQPPRSYPDCDLGVDNPWDHDCLQCNRCVRELRRPK